MAMIPGDERELLLPLYAGLHERPVWTTFLARLRARTGATRTVLIPTKPRGLSSTSRPRIAPNRWRALSPRCRCR